MRRATLCFLATLILVRGEAHAGPLPVVPTVQAVSGYLFDEGTGRWTSPNVFDPGFVPLNRLSPPLLLVVTVDLGNVCVVRQPSDDEARAIAKGERAPPTRPAGCERPPGRVVAEVRYGDGKLESQAVELSRFFSGFDGKIRVPILVYRRLPCMPLEIAVRTSVQRSPLRKKVDFSCRE